VATDLTWVAERHCERCDACAEFFSEDPAFEQSLRREARGLGAEPAVGFEQRILRAVKEHQAEPPPARMRSLSLAFVGVAAGTALAIVLTQQTAVKDNGLAPRVATNETPASASLAGSPEPAATGWWNLLREDRPGRTFTGGNPLQEEIDSVYTDAQSVLGFLALNFLLAPAQSDADDAQNVDSGRG
jgi:hypothetical protein